MLVAANICLEQAAATRRVCNLRATSFCPAASRALVTNSPLKRGSFGESSRSTFCQGVAPQLALRSEYEPCHFALVGMHLGGVWGVETRLDWDLGMLGSSSRGAVLRGFLFLAAGTGIECCSCSLAEGKIVRDIFLQQQFTM